MQEFSEWGGELDYVNRLLGQDVRNNSAWNQRYFVISNTSKYTGDVIKEELRYTLGQIDSVPHNESAWNYLRGVLEDSELYVVEVRQFCDRLYSKEGIRSPHLLAYMIDMYDAWLEGEIVKGGGAEGCPEPSQLVHSMLKMCRELSDVHDTIRTQYWMYIHRTLLTKYTDYITTTTPPSSPTSPNDNQSGETTLESRDETTDQSEKSTGVTSS